jgi:hypothetical protein
MAAKGGIEMYLLITKISRPCFRSNATRLVFLISLTGLCACADSSHILTGMARPAISNDEVRVYTVAPVNSEQIALLSVDAVGWTTQGEMDTAIKGLKKEAAKLGANGVLLATVGTASSAVVGGVDSSTGTFWAGNSTSTVAKAVAIYLPPQ